MTLIEIILFSLLVIQFIYLFKRTNNMAALDDLKSAVTNLDISVDSIIVTLQNLKTQLGDSVLAADIDLEVLRLKEIKAKLDAANQ